MLHLTQVNPYNIHNNLYSLYNLVHHFEHVPMVTMCIRTIFSSCFPHLVLSHKQQHFFHILLSAFADNLCTKWFVHLHHTAYCTNSSTQLSKHNNNMLFAFACSSLLHSSIAFTLFHKHNTTQYNKLHHSSSNYKCSSDYIACISCLFHLNNKFWQNILQINNRKWPCH